MEKKLPQAFVDKMQRLLGDEFADFAASFGKPRHYGLRLNPLKVSAGDYMKQNPFGLTPVPWAAEGFYYDGDKRPGKHPHYYAGLYYIQEPSAMAPVEWLDVKPGEKVLDLCAAPGGKSTQIAGKLQGEGLLVANDNQPERVKALVKNLALFGVRNAVVTGETPERLAGVFAGFFDKILIDAPCSGEGMFRKDPDITRAWDKHSVAACAAMQADILDRAAAMLKPGGRIVYSTCTFSPEENEGSIARFLMRHPAFSAVPTRGAPGFSPGRPDWIEVGAIEAGNPAGREIVQSLTNTWRLWPHRLDGEGHFVAVLQHDGSPVADVSGEKPGAKRNRKKNVPDGKGKAADLAPWFSFMDEHLTERIDGRWISFGDRIFWTDPGWALPDLEGLSVARPGWYVGHVRRNRFVPSQALALGLSLRQFVRRIHLSADAPETLRYLRGETLALPEDRLEKAAPDMPAKGYCLVGVDGYPVGFAKWQDGILKNEYPPGWRWT